MIEPITIEKHPKLDPAADYELLRRLGLQYIERLGSKLWTDYNTHDPGITILEALCYAITDLSYRTSFDIQDLLANKPSEDASPERQAFFSPRRILTMNPWTTADYRKLLVDLPGVKNAWLICKEDNCNGLELCVNCKASELVYKIPGSTCEDESISIRGLYDVLVQFDDEDENSNLNSGKVRMQLPFFNAGQLYHASLELRLPSWYEIALDLPRYKLFISDTSVITEVIVDFISGNKHDDHSIPSAEFIKGLKRPLFASVTIRYKTHPAGSVLELKLTDLPLRIWFRSDAHRRLLEFDALVDFLQVNTNGHVFPTYLDKLRKAKNVMREASASLHAHRNLCEDYCTITAIESEDIAVCGDIEVEADADIEQVLATAYYLISQYFSPDIRFYSLQQRLDEGISVDEIFNGPALTNGFIDDAQLASTDLRKNLYVSDIINLLIDIDGIRSVRNFSLVRYNDDGFISETASWSMAVSDHHQPHLYLDGSKMLVYKNGLPFLPNPEELSDSIQVIRGLHAQPQFALSELDLPVPRGKWSNLNEHQPLQYSLPFTYGVSEAGLPASASAERKAQARQLSAYLLFFDQMLVNYLQQLTNAKELFAIDPAVSSTIYSGFIDDASIAGVEDLYHQFDAPALRELTRDSVSFSDRRNRFLDHQLSRFAEQFSDYALMLYSQLDRRQIHVFPTLFDQYPFLEVAPFIHDDKLIDFRERADQMLIADKISFLKDIPFISSNRARAFNYKLEGKACHPGNIAGLKSRIMRVLGVGEFDSYFVLNPEKDDRDRIMGYRWYFRNDTGGFHLFSRELYSPATAKEELDADITKLRLWMTDINRFKVEVTGAIAQLHLTNDLNEIIASAGKVFTQAEAEAERDRLIAFVQSIFQEEKIFIVEHLLLRPRNLPAAKFQLYEEKDVDGKLFERRWRLVDHTGKIYLSSSTRYYDADLTTAQHKAMLEILEVCKRITNLASYTIHKEIKWVLNLVDETGEVIATRKHAYNTEEEAIDARDKLIAYAISLGLDKYHLHESSIPADLLVTGDPLLPICASPGCTDCNEHDPYSFRFSVILSGESGMLNNSIEFRRFAEQTIRTESPAHLGVKICWVSNVQLEEFRTAYCAWLGELAKPEPDAYLLHSLFVAFYNVFVNLKSVYPEARLHDCIDGNEDNRAFLDQTII